MRRRGSLIRDELCRAWTLVVALLLAVCWVTPARAGPPPEGFVAPELLNEVQIEYPSELAALDHPPAGTVVVQLTVGVDGVPKELSVVQGLHPKLDALALDAVRRLRYRPGKVDDTPVEVTQRMEIAFAPPEPAGEPSGEPKAEPPPEAQPEAEPEAEAEAEPEGPLRISGQLLEAGQRIPLGGASVLAVEAAADVEVGPVRKKRYGPQHEPAWQVQTYTDAEGRFELRGVPGGKVRVIVLAPGYERLEVIESVPADQTISVRYYVTRLSTNPYRTVVKTRGIEREEVTRRTITVEEIDNLPGTQGDALKAIQNFPGIARSPFGIGLLVIRGSDPTDSAVYLGEHEIPQLFHFGGITSVFNSDILNSIDFFPGNFDARYGDAIGGVVDVKPRAGRRDGYHGYVDSDLFDTGVLVEGPIGKGSFALSARRSYVDLLLPAVIPDDAGLDLTVAPRYWDYQALFDYPVSKGNLSVRVFGSDDRTRLVAADPNEVETDARDQFETTLSFHRADLVYRNRRGRWDILLTPSYRYDYFRAGAGDIFRFRVTTHSFSGRAELGYRISRRLRWDMGAQLYAGVFTIDAEAPSFPAEGVGSASTRLQTGIEESFAAPSVYGTLTMHLGDRFTLYPGARFTYHSLNFQRTATDPRLRFAWRVADRTTIKGGVGLYSQIPDPFEWNGVWGNPRIALEHALHTSLAVAQQFDPAITIEVTGFYKYLWDLATQSSVLTLRPDGTFGPESFANQGVGRIYGAEVFFRKELTENVFGWVSYTLSRSERRVAPDEPFVLFDLDQAHILTLIAVYRFPRNWQLGARFRLVSGNPYTPVVGATFAADDGDWVPRNGPENSERVAVFHQLDLRVDKRFVWKRVMLTTYLDVLNVYNQQNQEFVQYSYDFRVKRPIVSLPIVPSLGLKLEF